MQMEIRGEGASGIPSREQKKIEAWIFLLRHSQLHVKMKENESCLRKQEINATLT